uniref:Uncharacterized protein n=1 Tax=Rhizophora mucronata TaxID=61149 RepID=A0A2P2L7V3_RHIMU
MSVGLEFIFDSLGPDNPFIVTISVLVDKLGGLVVVHGLNLCLCVHNVRRLDLKFLNKHVLLPFIL